MTPDDLRQLIKECVREALDMDTPEGIKTMQSIYKQDMLEKLDQFTKSYIYSAIEILKDSLNDEPEKSPDDDTYSDGYDDKDDDEGDTQTIKPEKREYSFNDLDFRTLDKMMKDCADFQDKYRELYSQAGWTDDMAGYDFWLTRNHHGAGFWDRSKTRPDTLYSTELAQQHGQKALENVGDYLTKVAHSYGEFDLYIGDDGTIYGSPLK